MRGQKVSGRLPDGYPAGVAPAGAWDSPSSHDGYIVILNRAPSRVQYILRLKTDPKPSWSVARNPGVGRAGADLTPVRQSKGDGPMWAVVRTYAMTQVRTTHRLAPLPTRRGIRE
jgi:hypothetical protein